MLLSIDSVMFLLLFDKVEQDQSDLALSLELLTELAKNIQIP